MSKNHHPARHRANPVRRHPARVVSHAGSIGRSTAVVTAASALLLSGGLPANAVDTAEELHQAGEPATHTVVSGDTLGAISGRYGVELGTVFSLNEMNQTTIIYPGDIVSVSGDADTPTPATHTVVSGDTLGIISGQYGVELGTVFSLNQMNQSTIIYPGDVINLTGDVAVGGPAPAAPAVQALSVQALPAPPPAPAPAAPPVPAPAPAPAPAPRMVLAAVSTAPAPVSRLSLPLANASVNSPFGYRGGELHTGLDFAAGCGTPVLSSAAGTVIEAGFSAYGGGNRIVIDHGNGLQTTYNHLETIGIQLNQSVGSGAPIGVAGSTGNSTGCHLHFEVVVNGQTVDPAAWL
ncbi:peptidoglycan DD-metalloendopeptidase family protein [Arthrobacter sp. HLT1-21]